MVLQVLTSKQTVQQALHKLLPKKLRYLMKSFKVCNATLGAVPDLVRSVSCSTASS